MRKDNPIAWILCGLIFSGMLLAFPDVCFSQKAPAPASRASSNPAGFLQISLAADQATYSVGDEIHFDVVLANTGSTPFRILLDNEFVGSEIKCTDVQGRDYAYEGGYTTWSPVVGTYTGRTHLLKPNEKINIKMDALVYDRYELIFSNLFDRRGGSGNQELKKHIHLPPDFPDKYLSAGRIFRLQKPGTYRFAYVYEATEADKHWSSFTGARTREEASVDLLWIGQAVSNAVEIRLE